MCKQIVQQLSLAQQKWALCRRPKTYAQSSNLFKIKLVAAPERSSYTGLLYCFYAASLGSLLLQ